MFYLQACLCFRFLCSRCPYGYQSTVTSRILSIWHLPLYTDPFSATFIAR